MTMHVHLLRNDVAPAEIKIGKHFDLPFWLVVISRLPHLDWQLLTIRYGHLPRFGDPANQSAPSAFLRSICAPCAFLSMPKPHIVHFFLARN